MLTISPKTVRTGAAALLALSLAGYAAAGYWLPGRNVSVFSGDMGVKYIQIANLAQGHAWLANESEALDPSGRLFPLRPPFVFEHDARTYSVYLNPFVYLCGALYRVGGVPACRMLPLLSVVFAVLLVLRLASAMGLSPPLAAFAAFAALWATPAWFYGWVLWEHAPAMLLCLAATLLTVAATGRAARPRLIAAGTLLGLAASCRPEAMLYAVALGCAGAAVQRRLLPAMAIVGVTVASYLAVSLALPGLPFEQHLSQITGKVLAASSPSAGLADLLQRRSTITTRTLTGVLQPPPAAVPAFLGMATAVAAAALLLLGAWGKARRSRTAIALVAATAAAATLPAAMTVGDRRTLLTGWLVASPLIVAALPLLLAPRSHRRARGAQPQPTERAHTLVCLTTVLFVLGALLLAQNDGGNQWGARYLMPAVPLCVCIVVAALARASSPTALLDSRATTAALACIIAASVAVQVVGVRNHVAMRVEKAVGFSRLAAFPGRYIVTSAWFVPQEAALVTLTGDKSVLLVRSGDDLRYAIERLGAVGQDELSYVEPARATAGGRRLGGYHEADTMMFHVQPFTLRGSRFTRPTPPG